MQMPSAQNSGVGMWVALSDAQRDAQRRFRSFAEEHITPHAATWDEQAALPMELIHSLRDNGLLGAPFPEEVGGQGMDQITYGLLTEELGRACSSARTVLTVHDMATSAILRWGSRYLKSEIVPQLASAKKFCSFALTEPNVGSDARNVETEAFIDGDDFVINGHKQWISFGLIADYFLVFCKVEGKLAAFLVPSDTPGLTREPAPSVIGTRATLIAELEFDGCRIPKENLVGRVGFGFSHVALAGLELGRYSVAWGSVGLAQACLEASMAYTAERRQFGVYLNEHQLVQRKLTNMLTNTRAARLLCFRAGTMREMADPGATTETMIAKYFASRTANNTASDAVQLHGAQGLSENLPLGKYLRDAKVLEVIEGSTQIQQIAIARYPPREM